MKPYRTVMVARLVTRLPARSRTPTIRVAAGPDPLAREFLPSAQRDRAGASIVTARNSGCPDLRAHAARLGDPHAQAPDARAHERCAVHAVDDDRPGARARALPAPSLAVMRHEYAPLTALRASASSVPEHVQRRAGAGLVKIALAP